MEQRKAEPRDDLLSKLVHAEVDGSRLTDEEVLGFLRLLLPAGAETTYRLTGSCLYALLEHPEVYEEVRADRAASISLIQETLRWESPVQFVSREPTVDVESPAHPVPAGAMLSVVVGSANRDERHYADPDRFDLHRKNDDHLAFGFGEHFCAGSHLALLEAAWRSTPCSIVCPTSASIASRGVPRRRPGVPLAEPAPSGSVRARNGRDVTQRTRRSQGAQSRTRRSAPSAAFYVLLGSNDSADAASQRLGPTEVAMPLDPQAKAFLDQIAALGGQPLSPMRCPMRAGSDGHAVVDARRARRRWRRPSTAASPGRPARSRCASTRRTAPRRSRCSSISTAAAG